MVQKARRGRSHPQSTHASQFRNGVVGSGDNFFTASRRRFSPNARTNNSRPLTMNTNAGCGYIRPFNSVVSLLASLKNISRGFSGLHQPISSGVLDSMLAGNTSGARHARSPLASLSRKPVVTDWPAPKYGAPSCRLFTSCRVAKVVLPRVSPAMASRNSS